MMSVLHVHRHSLTTEKNQPIWSIRVQQLETSLADILWTQFTARCAIGAVRGTLRPRTRHELRTARVVFKGGIIADERSIRIARFLRVSRVVIERCCIGRGAHIAQSSRPFLYRDGTTRCFGCGSGVCHYQLTAGGARRSCQSR